MLPINVKVNTKVIYVIQCTVVNNTYGRKYLHIKLKRFISYIKTSNGKLKKTLW